MIADPLLQALKRLSGALLDAYVVVDDKQEIVDFNAGFRQLFPRNVARQLRKRTFPEVIELELAGQPLELAAECMRKETPLRYDEVLGRVADGDQAAFIASAVPLVTEARTIEGAFLTLRNVTDEAQVQVKYKTMLEEEAREREVLQRRIRSAETELVEVKDELASVERELLEYKKGLLV